MELKYISEIHPHHVPAYDYYDRLRLVAQLARYRMGLSTATERRNYRKNNAVDFDVIIEYLISAEFFYEHDRYHNKLIATNPSHNGTYVEVYLQLDCDQNSVTLDVLGQPHMVDETLVFFDKLFERSGPQVTIASAIDKNSDGIVYNITRPHFGKADLPLQSFYPWLDRPIEDYYKAYLESGSSLLLLMGLAGTGKSTFMRGLVKYEGNRSLLAYSRAVIEHGKLIPEFLASQDRLLICEDLDMYLGSREDGNSHMSTILNATDGVVRHPGKNVLLSTNLPTLSKVDEALVRDGRCFGVLDFRALTWEEANVVMMDLDREPIFTSGNSPMTLATILKHGTPGDNSSLPRTKVKVGF